MSEDLGKHLGCPCRLFGLGCPYEVIPRTSLLLVDRHCGPERCLGIADVPPDAVVHDACDGTVPAPVKGRVGWRLAEHGLQVGGRIGNRSVDEDCDVRLEYNTVRLHAGIGYVSPDDEHEGRGEQIRKARREGMRLARQQRIAYRRNNPTSRT
ncbi:MAG: hypothetical protein ACLFV0_08000 [Nitriliruptoraceae bacterium]